MKAKKIVFTFYINKHFLKIFILSIFLPAKILSIFLPANILSIFNEKQQTKIQIMKPFVNKPFKRKLRYKIFECHSMHGIQTALKRAI